MPLGERAAARVRTGVDPGAPGSARSLHVAHDAFLTDRRTGPALRQVVVDSWHRSLQGGLDPEHALAPILLDEARLAEVRANHPLNAAMPMIRRLLVDSAADAGLLVAVSDAAGQLLWVEGAPGLVSRAESMHFMAGADWRETSAGTNAPGTALALDRPVQILGAEHLVRHVTPWSCTAAPIHEPDTGAILGVLDLTGGPEVVNAQTMSLVRATVAAVEAELRLDRLRPWGGRSVDDVAAGPDRVVARSTAEELSVLGARGARLRDRDGEMVLSLRHSEVLLLLALRSGGDAEGWSSDELAVALSEDDRPAVTVRAELSRLRVLLGTGRLASRPYRLTGPLRTDLDRVRAELAAGRLRSAVAAYPGPVLPQSTAPAVVAAREDLHGRVRSALLAGGDVDALLSFADTAHGRGDLDVWRAVQELLPVGSPRHAQVDEHVRRLDLELG